MSDQVILWGIILAYMAFIFTKGVLKVRQIDKSDDFLVAGRNVGWLLLFCTMGATVIGGGASIGAIGRTYEWGVLMLLVSLGWYFHFIFAGLLVAPKFREAKLYTVAGYFGHRFGEHPRFFVLILSLLFSIFIVAAQMAAFGSVFAAIMPGVAADWAGTLRLAIIIGGAMVVIYSTAGGLLAVIHTDFYQFVVLIAGFIITLGFCIPDIFASYDRETAEFIPNRFSVIDVDEPDRLAARILSGKDEIALLVRDKLDPETAREIADHDPAEPLFRELTRGLTEALNEVIAEPDFYSEERFSEVVLSLQTKELLALDAPDGRELRRLNLSLIQDAFSAELAPNRKIPGDFFRTHGGKGWLFLITTFFAFLLGETFAPGYATRYCVGKDIKHTRVGIAGAGVFLALTFPVILFFIALYARIHFPDIPAQQALPMVITQLNNPIVAGLIIGALMMAVMSSADSALNSATAIFVKDLFEHQLQWTAVDDRRILVLSRLFTVGLGISAIGIAVLWSDIIGLLMFTYHVWAPAIILPVFVGVLSKRRSASLTRNIFLTMLIATAATLLYRLFLFLKSRFSLALFPNTCYDFMEVIDAAVFGVGVSCLTFAALSYHSRKKPAPR